MMGINRLIKIDNIHNYFIILLLFTITIKTSVSFLLEAIIFLLWIWNGKFREKLQIIFTDKLSLTFLALFLIHLAGIFWTQNLHEGLQILSKQKIYIFAPLIISFFDKRFAKYAIYSFLSAMLISEIYSLYLYITGGVHLFGSFPSPFMHHMHYSLILAFTFGYLINEIDFKKILEKKELFYLLFATLTIVVLFINKGRIGQVSLLLVFFILAVNKFKLSFIKSIIAVGITTTIIFLGAYQFSNQFKSRFERATHEFHQVIGTDKRDSIACRFEMWEYAIELGKKSPIIGIGTGDSISEMKSLLGENEFQKLFNECGLGMKYQFNPHNNFLLYFMQFGTIGVILLLLIFIYQFKIAYLQNSTPMMILISVTLIGMMSASPISMHIKYIFFYALLMTMIYLDNIYKGEKISV
jgi:O-antigen ligase